VKTVCATSVLYGVEAFSTLGETVSVPEEAISRNVLADVDALIVRSRTAITADLLEGTPVAFVGTATAGVDHIDLDYLDSRGIAWAAAKGSNANSVAEYVVASMLYLVRRHGQLLEDLSVGIVGVGHVGQKVREKCLTLGMRVLLNDPARAVQEHDPAFLPLTTVLNEADLITLHVPLSDGEPFPTRHLANHRFFEQLRPGSFLINSSRGEVVDSEALLIALDRGILRGAVLDVWEGEPVFRPDVLARVDIGTPHIAGHSFEGKLKGTLMLYEEACGFFEKEGRFEPAEHILPGLPDVLDLDVRGLLPQDVLWEAVKYAYNIEEDDRALREGAVNDPAARGGYFSGLRRNYPVRREFPASRIHFQHGDAALCDPLRGLGFLLI
jgi:erythronate-4-phosphate dehydrogenase